MNARHLRSGLPIVCLFAFWAAGTKAEEEPEPRPPQLEAASLGETRNVHAFGPNLLCAQPSAEDFAAAKERGIDVVVSLRGSGEIDWDEEAAVHGQGLKFYRFDFLTPESLTDDVLNKSRRVLRNSEKEPVLLHCGSANRVGAVWLAHRVLDHDVPIDKALEEAETVGLRTPAYRERVMAYIIKSMQKTRQ